MRVLLVNTGNDDEIGGNANSQSYPPLGIISLGTAIAEEFGDKIELSLLDGQVDDAATIKQQIRKMRPDVVGVSMYCTSIRKTLEFIQEAKAVGAVTLLGNDHAAIHHRTLLHKVKEIDYVCTADVGEETIVPFIRCLLTKADIEGVPKLSFRSATGEVVNTRPGPAMAQIAANGEPKSRSANALDELPIPDRRLLPRRYWESYLRNFKLQCRRTFNSQNVGGIATINRARGCARAKNPCRYCGIADLRPRGSSPEAFWRDVRRAREQVNAIVLYEAFDSATSWPSLMKGWLEARPADLDDTRFFMYAQAAETNEGIVDTFSKLGVFCVNTGFDSGDTRTLQLLKGKQDSAEKNRRAAELWTRAGIEIHTSFVLMGMGSEAETRRSLDHTVAFAEWLAKNTHTVSLDSAMFYPDKTAPVGAWIWDPGLAAKQAKDLGWDFIDFDLLQKASHRWRDEVLLDPLELCIDFAKICRVEPQLLVDYNRRIQSISNRYQLNFGHSLAGAEPVKAPPEKTV